MRNSNEANIIIKLIELTKEKKIEWNYLDAFPAVYSQLLMEPKSPLENKNVLESLTFTVNKKTFDSDNSFITNIKENYIVIYAIPNDKRDLSVLGDRLALLLVPRTFKDISSFVDDEEGSLVRLHTLVKSNFPSSEDVVNDILEM